MKSGYFNVVIAPEGVNNSFLKLATTGIKICSEEKKNVFASSWERVFAFLPANIFFLCIFFTICFRKVPIHPS